MFESRKRPAENVNEETNKRRLLDSLKALRLIDDLSENQSDHRQEVSKVEIRPGYLNIPNAILNENEIEKFSRFCRKSVIEYQDPKSIVWVHFIRWFDSQATQNDTDMFIEDDLMETDDEFIMDLDD